MTKTTGGLLWSAWDPISGHHRGHQI